MPVWEHYEVEARVSFDVKNRDGELIVSVHSRATAEGQSNRQISKPGMAQAANAAIKQAHERIAPLVEAAELQRNRELNR